ncbi:hypothetical protein ACQY0O_007519 [Thecaphora frezii]
MLVPSFVPLSALTLALAASGVAGQAPHSGPHHKFAQRATKRATQASVSSLFTPTCQTSDASYATADVINNCLDLSGVKAIVAFGDSYTSCGSASGRSCPELKFANGLPATAPTLDYLPGGRSSNGYTWVEDLAKTLQTSLNNFAVGGATVDHTIIVGSSEGNDLVNQYRKFRYLNLTLEPETTLCTFFFGINDNGSVGKKASDTATRNQLLHLAAISEKNYIDQVSKDTCDRVLVLDIRSGNFSDTLRYSVDNRAKLGNRIAYLNVASFFDDMEKRYQTYGFSTTTPCVEGTGNGQSKLVCTNAQLDTAMYWNGKHPTGKTHQYLADYVVNSLKTCPDTKGKCATAKVASKAATTSAASKVASKAATTSAASKSTTAAAAASSSSADEVCDLE